MTQVRDVLGRARPLAVAVAFVAASFVPLLSFHNASAGALLNRSLMTTSSVVGTDAGSGVEGDASNGAEVGHTYTFTPSTTMDVQALSFEVCNTAFGYLHTAATSSSGTSDNCVETDDGAGVGVETEDAVTGFNVTGSWTAANIEVNTTPSEWTFAKIDASYWTITRGSTLSMTAGVPVTIEFTADATSYFTNPTVNGTYFVHISAYGTAAADYHANYTQATFDEGTVTSSVATAIDINTRVQETLKFSVEGDMRDNGGAATHDNTGTPTAGVSTVFNGPTTASTTCEPLQGLGTIRMGDLSSNALSASTTYDAVSYFRVATNSANGTNVYYAGETLESGTESIDAIGAPGTAIAAGGEQFGLGFIAVPDLAGAGTTTDVDRDGDASSTYLRATNGYHDATTNAGFVAGAPRLLAESDGIVECDTAAIRYIANIANETAAGIYSTRIVYIASPSY